MTSKSKRSFVSEKILSISDPLYGAQAGQIYLQPYRQRSKSGSQQRFTIFDSFHKKRGGERDSFHVWSLPNGRGMDTHPIADIPHQISQDQLHQTPNRFSAVSCAQDSSFGSTSRRWLQAFRWRSLYDTVLGTFAKVSALVFVACRHRECSSRACFHHVEHIMLTIYGALYSASEFYDHARKTFELRLK